MKSILALALAAAVSNAAFAGETTEVEVSAHGAVEKVRIVDLAVGETRQLHSEAGTLVTATRTEDELLLDIAGEKTSVAMHAHEGLDDAELAALLEDADVQDGKRVIIVNRRHDGDAAAGADGKQVIVKRRVTKGDDAR